LTSGEQQRALCTDPVFVKLLLLGLVWWGTTYKSYPAR
jgi:hypothetical protein